MGRTVAGRSFGAPLVFLLMAGEIYTTFTFLGGSGFAYGRGGPVYYILCYGTLAYVMSYFIPPPIWRYARDHGLYSQADFFAGKYQSRWLGALVSVVGVVALIPYLVLQFKGLGIIVEAAGYGAIGATLAVWMGAAVATAYVMMSGVRGSAWTAVAKDVIILVVVVFLGIYFPLHYYGGLGAMFAAIEAAKPGFIVLPEHGESAWWFSSTVLLTALGFYMWPHTFGSIYTARDSRVIRQNAMVLPLYQLILLFVFLVGFAAILQVPGLQGPDVDLALFKLSVKSFDPWIVGIIGAAGVLTALVPGSMILMTGDASCQQSLSPCASLGWRPPRRPRRETVGASRRIGRGLFHARRRADDRSAVVDGLQLCHPAFSRPGAEPDKDAMGHACGRRRRHRLRRRDRRRRQPDAHHYRHAVSGFAGGDAGAQCWADRARGERDRAGCRQRGREAGDGAVGLRGEAHRPLRAKRGQRPPGRYACLTSGRPISRHTGKMPREENMGLAVCGFATLVLLALPAHADMSGGKIKIGVLTDLSGPYEQNSGVGSVEAAKMAAEEFGNAINGVPVEIVSADHQNKLDIGAAIARRWFDLDGVDAVTDLVNSAVGFAVLEIAKTNNKAVLLTSAGSADFTGKACAPNTSVHWVYDNYEIGSAIGQALPQLGKTWFFITADYVFGRAL